MGKKYFTGSLILSLTALGSALLSRWYDLFGAGVIYIELGTVRFLL